MLNITHKISLFFNERGILFMLLISEISKIIKCCSLMIMAGYFRYRIGILVPKTTEPIVVFKTEEMIIYATSFCSSGTT